QKLGHVLQLDDQSALYRRLVSQCDRPGRYLPGAEEPQGLLWDESVTAEFPDFATRMQFLDTATYLPDDILTKVDRASMAVSLEVRVPLLDHRLVEFAWRLPRHLKLRAGKGKWLLRQLLARHVPTALTERPKQGFALPLAQWLRGPLRDWGEAMLSEQRLADAGILDTKAVRNLWQIHQSGRRNEQHSLWTLLMFQAWHERWC
ncbi:MAG: asparagine synthetase B family protein, partial [Alphaproteobacteria bacterium]